MEKLLCDSFDFPSPSSPMHLGLFETTFVSSYKWEVTRKNSQG